MQKLVQMRYSKIILFRKLSFNQFGSAGSSKIGVPFQTNFSTTTNFVGPIIDGSKLLASDSEFDECAQSIADACQDFGFFQLINHQIDDILHKKFLHQTKKLFALPKDVKMKFKRSEKNSRGWFNDEFTKQKIDWKEGFDFGAKPYPDFPDQHPDNHCQDGFNLWPEKELKMKQTMETYFNELTNLSKRINEAMAKGLELPRSFFEPFFDRHTSFLRLNYYPVCPDPNQHLGISPHHDAGWLTILYADPEVKSLQFARNNEWVTVSPIPGAYLINTGDMAQVWSNDKYIAPTHRVLANRDKARYSAPFFFNPNYETEISPLETSIGKDGRLYKPFTWGEFRMKRYMGDYTDVGTENQIHHYRPDKKIDIFNR